jgi:hypothetical protein
MTQKYMCWYAHEEPYVFYDTMVERMVGSTSSVSIAHEVVNDNSNSYRNIIMDTMRMNKDHVDQCPIIDEKLNANVTRCFELLKDFNEPL